MLRRSVALSSRVLGCDKEASCHDGYQSSEREKALDVVNTAVNHHGLPNEEVKMLKEGDSSVGACVCVCLKFRSEDPC